MKPTIFVSAVKTDVRLPKRKLEAVANYNGSKSTISRADFKLPGYENVSWRFLSAMAEGSVWLTILNKQNNRVVQRQISISGVFIAVCTRPHYGNYRLRFGISLS